ncbi:unnamed protein product [Orchesella dallaii]|uniref:Secreted protein n=1 Tax=Orchesella dallaii TaxID=48710 RepID=A0ABP1QF61_9HEXA
MKQTVEFFVLFGLIYVVILVSSRVVPDNPTLLEGDNGGDLSRVLGLHQGDHNNVADDLLQPDQVKRNQVVLRRKRWAVPAVSFTIY